MTLLEMINTEELIPLVAANSLFPEAHRPSVGTLVKWSRHGLRGVVLTTVSLGGKVFTTRQRVEEFLQAAAARRFPGRRAAQAAAPAATARKLAKRRAATICERAGL